MSISEDKKAESARLDSLSAAYGEQFAYAFDNDLILNWYPQRIMALASTGSLLELGIGHGFSTVKFSEHYQRHLVIDGSPEIIKSFQTKYPECKAELCEAFFETFDTAEKFDLIVMGFILEHVDDPALILQIYRSFLKPGGSIFVTVPNAEALNKRFGYEAGLLNNLFDLGDGDIALGHQRLFSVTSLKGLVRSLGYVDVHTEGLFLKPLTTKQLLGLNISNEVAQAMMKVGVDYPELSVGILMQIKCAESSSAFSA